MSSDPALAADLARLRYHCRRGMLELDALLTRFTRSEQFEQLDVAEREVFAQLLAQNDPQLYRWLIGHERCPNPEFQALIAAIHSADFSRDG